MKFRLLSWLLWRAPRRIVRFQSVRYGRRIDTEILIFGRPVARGTLR